MLDRRTFYTTSSNSEGFAASHFCRKSWEAYLEPNAQSLLWDVLRHLKCFCFLSRNADRVWISCLQNITRGVECMFVCEAWWFVRPSVGLTEAAECVSPPSVGATVLHGLFGSQSNSIIHSSGWFSNVMFSLKVWIHGGGFGSLCNWKLLSGWLPSSVVKRWSCDHSAFCIRDLISRSDLDLSLSGISVSHCQERVIVRSFSFSGGVTVGRLLIVGSLSLLGGSHVGTLSLSWGSHCQECFTVGRSQCRECSGYLLVMEVHQCGMRYSMLSESRTCHNEKLWIL